MNPDVRENIALRLCSENGLRFAVIHLFVKLIFLRCLAVAHRNEASNGARQQLPGAFLFHFPFQIRQHDRHVPAKFPDDLAASAARRRQRSASVTTAMASKPRSPSETALKIATRSAQQRQSVGGVFDVAAGENAAGFRAHGRAHAKIRKRRVGVLARLLALR